MDTKRKQTTTLHTLSNFFKIFCLTESFTSSSASSACPSCTLFSASSRPSHSLCEALCGVNFSCTSLPLVLFSPSVLGTDATVLEELTLASRPVWPLAWKLTEARLAELATCDFLCVFLEGRTLTRINLDRVHHKVCVRTHEWSWCSDIVITDRATTAALSASSSRQHKTTTGTSSEVLGGNQTISETGDGGYRYKNSIEGKVLHQFYTQLDQFPPNVLQL